MRPVKTVRPRGKYNVTGATDKVMKCAHNVMAAVLIFARNVTALNSYKAQMAGNNVHAVRDVAKHRAACVTNVEKYNVEFVKPKAQLNVQSVTAMPGIRISTALK